MIISLKIAVVHPRNRGVYIGMDQDYVFQNYFIFQGLRAFQYLPHSLLNKLSDHYFKDLFSFYSSRHMNRTLQNVNIKKTSGA